MKNLLTGESNFRRVLLITVLIITLYLSISMDGPSAQQVTQPLAINLDELEWGPPGGGNGSPWA